MTLRDYLTPSEVERNYGEYGLEQRFMREFTVNNDYYLELALNDIRGKNLYYSIGRIGANILSLTALVIGFKTDIGITMPTIPIILFGMSELHRLRQYQEDIANRKQFTRFMREKIKQELSITEIQREEFKLRLGLEPPF